MESDDPGAAPLSMTVRTMWGKEQGDRVAKAPLGWDR